MNGRGWGCGGGAALARAVEASYGRGQTDYSIEPLALVGEEARPVGRIGPGDAVIFCCRRGEREVELTEAFVEDDFPYFPRPALPGLAFVILTLYHEKFKHLPVAFAPAKLADTLGEAVSRAGLRQLRTAESEKFAHVTYFLNGGRNELSAGEEAWKVPSPRGVPFETVPGLSLDQVKEKVFQGLEQQYDLIVTNFANGDVIGHTASAAAKLRCAEIVDRALGEVLARALAADYVVFVTADHGNLEEMVTAEGRPHVAHTANPVAFIAVDPRSPAAFQRQVQLRAGCSLSSIAPTVLAALDVPAPPPMTSPGILLAPAWGGRRKVLLIILDGWGIGKDDATNPISLASTPVWDSLLERYPHTFLDASGAAVGLQPGKAGNSEAGHMNIGAGRVVLQDDVRLDAAMGDGLFSANETLCQAIAQVQGRGKALHLISLLTEKSSHGSIAYPLALLQMAKAAGQEQNYLHIIFDGRSTPPGSAPALLHKLDGQLAALGTGLVVSGVGRGIALDRDGNYARIEKAYRLLVEGVGTPYPWC